MISDHFIGEVLFRPVQLRRSNFAGLDLKHIADRGFLTKSFVVGAIPKAELIPIFSPAVSASAGKVRSEHITTSVACS